MTLVSLLGKQEDYIFILVSENL